MSRDLRELLQRPGAWLWLVLAAGAGLRLYFLLATEGTFDVAIKQHHGHQVNSLGLLEYYRQAEVFNHPPPAGQLFAALEALAERSGIPFRLLLRAPFALLDLGSALLLLRLFRGSPQRWIVFAAYWLHPLAIIFSAYHGNTDPAVAFFVLLALLFASSGRPWLTGLAVGLGLWVKLPVLVAAPAFLFAFPVWRERGQFALAALLVGSLGYLPAAVFEPALLFERIARYPGSGVETPRGISIWGMAEVLHLSGSQLAQMLERYNTLVCGAAIFALAWLRRGAWAPRELGVTVCGSFLVLYGVSSTWAWQYLAWSIPFWFFLGWVFTGLATLLLGGYVYGAYALFTGSPWLRGRWDFVNHAPWPGILDVLRDASVLLCFGTACLLLVKAVAAELRRRRAAPP